MNDIPQEDSDQGTLAVLLERANQRIPNLLAIKKHLEAGEKLSMLEVEELEHMLEPPGGTFALLERHPEYEELTSKITSLLEEIAHLALDLEKKG